MPATKPKIKKPLENDLLPGKLVKIPVSEQTRNRVFSYKKPEPGRRVFVGVDTETEFQLGQKAETMQVAMRTGPHEWEAYYIKNSKNYCPHKQEEEQFIIQGETINVTKMEMPSNLWKDLLNNLLKDPLVTLSFFNIFFDIPLIYNVEPSKDEKLKDYWFFFTDQAIRLKRLPNHRSMILQSKFQFLDTQTVAKVLLDESSLMGASKAAMNKIKLPFDPENIKYAVWDAVLTAWLAEELDNKIKSMGMDIRPDLIRSPATFPKYLLSSMGIRRPRFETPDIAPWWHGFFGGKIETNPEYTKTPIIGDLVYSDISGQYAQAFRDTQAYKFMICEKIEVKTDTDPDTEKLLKPDPKNAHIMAKANIKNAIVPVKTDRVNLFPEATGTGLYMLPDLWAAKLLSPESKIEIIEAYIPTAIGAQNLENKHNLNPYDLPRDIIKRRAESTGPQNQFYKNTINTMYGITAEGSASNTKNKYKKMGVFGNPIVASTITAYGRYLVASGERYLKDHGSQAYYVHTDSFFIDAEHFNGLQKHLKENHGAGLTIKGRGESLLTISAGKYGLFQDKKGDRAAVDKDGNKHLSNHGFNEPFQLPGQKRFFELMAKNWGQAFKCYAAGEDPRAWPHFHGSEYKKIKTANVQSVHSYNQIRNKFENSGLDPDLVRCGMFFFIGYRAEQGGTPGIFPTYEMAAENSEVSLAFFIRNHFSQDDQKYNYDKKRPWRVDLNAKKETKERQDYFTVDF